MNIDTYGFGTFNEISIRTNTKRGDVHDVLYPAVLAVGGKHICIGEYSSPEQAAEVMEIGHITINRLIIDGII